MGVLRRFTAVLDRPPFRPLLAKGFNRFAARGSSDALRVRHDGEFWLYESGGVALPHERSFKFGKWDRDNLPGRIAHYRAETDDCWFFRYKPKPGDIIVDVGAEIGTDALFFSRAVGPSGKVVAIEAVPETYAKLLSTIRANRLDNVVPVGLAISDAPGELRLSTDKGVQANHVSDTGVAVKADTLDAILADLERIDLLKMNIEGAERLAIRGMGETLAKTEHVAIACHDFVATSADDQWFRTKELVRDYLVSNGFEVITRDDDPREYVRYHLHASRPSRQA